MMRRSGWSRSWWASMLTTLALLALLAAACGPEADRQRNGGTGGSSRAGAPPTQTTAPELFVKPTANQPYATEGPLPTLLPLATQTPGFAVPTSAPNTTTATPGAVGSPAASPTR